MDRDRRSEAFISSPHNDPSITVAAGVGFQNSSAGCFAVRPVR
jgi:hypothetical protein